MAMSMECTFVAEVFTPSIPFRSDMIDFNVIPILKKESTPFAFPLLLVQEFGSGATEKRMVSQPCTPVPFVPVIWACGSLHFGMPLDFGSVVSPEFGSSIGEGPCSFLHMPVFPGNPSFPFVGVSSACPFEELMKQDVLAPTECFSGNNGSVIVRPSTYLGVQFFDELAL
jgi:hypothetical protein